MLAEREVGHRFPAAMTLVLNVVSVAVILLGPRSNWVVPAGVAGSPRSGPRHGDRRLRQGWRPAAPAFGHPGGPTHLRLFSWPTVGAAMNPIVRIVEVFIASALPQGKHHLLHYGNRLASAVGGTIIFRSIMVTVSPASAGLHLRRHPCLPQHDAARPAPDALRRCR